MDNIAVEVSRMYIRLKKLDRKNELLKYIRSVEPDGRFYWNNRKIRLNGERVKSWLVFYERFSGSDLNGLTEREIGSRLPDLLENYYLELEERVGELEARR